MNALNHLLSPEVMRLMALTLLHFLWQGTALASLAYAGMVSCRNASTRYAIGVAMLVVMAIAPGITFLALADQDRHANSSEPVQSVVIQPANFAGSSQLTDRQSAPVQKGVPPLFMWLVELWFVGVTVLSLRSAGGVLVVERLRRMESKQVKRELLELCQKLQAKMGVKRLVNFCECVRLEAPAVAGWIRPAVMLPVSALTGLSEEQLSSVIAHELAHIKRFDPLVNLFQIGVETLLFYHPAVWWLNRRIREERENCCDDMAVAVCGNPLAYAHALARIAGSSVSPRLILAANGRPLAARVARLLGMGKRSEAIRGADLSLGLLCLSAALLAGGALIGVVRNVHAQALASSRPVSGVEEAPVFNDKTTAISPYSRMGGFAASPTAPKANPQPASALSPMPESAPQAAPAVGQSGSSSYIDGLKSAGLENLTVDQIIALKIQGVTAEYVKSMRESGMHVDVDNLVGMKIQEITPEYVREMRAATGQSLDADELIGMKVQGITPEYVKQIHDLGLKADANDLVGMKVQGISPDYIAEMRQLGLNLDSGDLIGMKVQGVTPEYVKAINALGLHPDAGELIGMKVQGVDADYLKKIQAAGFKLDVDDAIGAKVMGVTPEFIEKARSHGFKDLTLHQLISLKQAGVLDEAKQK